METPVANTFAGEVFGLVDVVVNITVWVIGTYPLQTLLLMLVVLLAHRLRRPCPKCRGRWSCEPKQDICLRPERAQMLRRISMIGGNLPDSDTEIRRRLQMRGNAL